MMSSFTETEVFHHFFSLDSKTSSIGIPNRMLKIVALEITPVFTVILNKSIETGIVPDILKISKSNLIDKRHHRKNCRLISYWLMKVWKVPKKGKQSFDTFRTFISQ